jgi:hypothetical protein
VLVEKAADYSAVTLPYTKVINPQGDQIDIGMISINATEADDPGQWKMRVAVPTPIIVTDSAGAEIMRIAIGGQRAAGIWDEVLQSFVKLDALYKDMTITGPEASVKIPETQVIYDFAKDAAGKWSGPGSITVKNIDATGTQNGGTFKAAEARIDFAIDQYDSNAIKQYREKLAALAETMAKDPATQKGVISPTHTAAIANTMMEFFTQAGNGMKIRYDVTGVTMTREEGGTTPLTRTITIPKSFFAMDLGGFMTGKVRLGVQGGYNGFVITPEEAGSKGLTPSEANVDLVFENIPIKEIIGLGKNTLDATMAQPDMKNLAGVSFLFKVPALLSQAGTYMTISNTYLGNEDINIKIEGRARADISAVNSATADATATFRNLDLLISRLKEQAKVRTQGDQAKIQSTITQLETVKQHATVQTGPNGPLHVLKFEMTPKGEMLLNGKDIRTLQGKPTQGIEKPAPVPEVAPGQPVAP